MSAGPPSPIQLAPVGRLFRLVRPGARYVVTREGEERPGVWLPDGTNLPPGATDDYPENEARSLLAVLRALEGRAAGKGGRHAAEASSPDGRLIARARRKLGLTMSGLAGLLGVDNAQLSRAMSGELPAKHRDAIKALLKSGAKKAT